VKLVVCGHAYDYENQDTEHPQSHIFQHNRENVSQKQLTPRVLL
jgi:hypothetical protein